MSNDNVKSATFVYVGRRANGYGSPTSVSHVIHQIAGKSAMAVGEECRFDKAPKNWLPGQIYEVEFDGDGYRLSAATFVGVWEDESQIAAWRTRDLADDIAVRSTKKFKNADHLAEVLLPLRREYEKLFGVNETTFELRVLKALRKPLSKEERDDVED